MWFLCGSCEIVALRACEPYLGVEWRRQISELCDVCEQRSWVVSLPVRPITALQTVPPLGLWYFQIAVARRRCNKTDEHKRSSCAVCTWKKKSTCTPVFALRTFESVLQAQPAQGAAVAADAGGAAAAGVERYGPYHQGQRQRQIQPAGDVHVHLQTQKTNRTCQQTFLSEQKPVRPVHVGEIQRPRWQVFLYTHERRPSGASYELSAFKNKWWEHFRNIPQTSLTYFLIIIIWMSHFPPNSSSWTLRWILFSVYRVLIVVFIALLGPLMCYHWF